MMPPESVRLAERPPDAAPAPAAKSAFAGFLKRLRRRLAVSGRGQVVLVPFLWLTIFFLVPFVIVFGISFSETVDSQPPVKLWELVRDVDLDQLKLVISVNLSNYIRLITDDLYVLAYLSSLKTAAISTVLCLLIGYPMAYAIARAEPSRRGPLMMLVILPFWTSFLIRVYSWVGILKANGVLANILSALGLVDANWELLYTPWAVYIGITYSYLPFMILPLYANLEKMDPALLEAAADLGCRPFKAFLKVTLPLSVPGIIAGSLLVFIPAVGEYVIPAMLGSPDTLMIGRVLWDEFFFSRDWPVASAVAIALLVFLVVPMMIFQYYQGKQQDLGDR
jgi:putrescine transport system permease protein